jgi:SAM-dependent methyltransferase
MPDQQSTTDHVNPAPLFELSVAYWHSCALFTAIELGVFEALAEGPQSVAQLSARTEAPEHSLKMLLDALVTIELLTRDGENFTNTPVTDGYLVPGNNGYMGETILFNARSYAAWGGLGDAVRGDCPSMSTTHFLGDDKDATRNFVLAMHRRALGVARCLTEMLDLSGRTSLLDVGGGPATYSRLLAEKYPDLKCTVMDLPGVLAVADELLSQSPARDRVTLRPGDLFHDDFGSGFDAVLFSGVLHRTEGESTINAFRKAAAAMEPGGLVVVSDLFTGGNSVGPVIPEMFSLHMLVTADEGQSLPLQEMPAMLEAAGLRYLGCQNYPAPLPHSLVLAEKV